MKLNKTLSMLLCTSLLLTVFSTSEILTSASNLSLKQNDTTTNNYALDTHDDDPVQGVLDEDDFETQAEYEEYLSTLPCARDATSSAAQKIFDDEIETTAILEYTITNLPIINTLQNFYVGTNYIYVTQKKEVDTDGDGVKDSMDVYISRCTKNTTTKVATFKDKMILKGFGHNQILEVFSRNSKIYLWVGCKANTAYPSALYCLQVGRIQYQPGTTIAHYYDIPRLASITYANKTATSFGDAKRVDAALSSDKTKIVFALRNIDGNIQYSYYDVEKINELLDEKEDKASKYVTFKNNNTLKNACLFSTTQIGNERILPNDSCQGIDMTSANSIYIAGGGLSQTPRIAKMVVDNNKYIYHKSVAITNQEFGIKSEIEGVHIVGNYLYFGIGGYDTNSKTQYLYSIDKNLLF